MKQTISRIGFSLCAVGLLAVSAVSQDHDRTEPCSLASLKGSYGFVRTGAEPAGPMASVGIAVFDGQGNSKFGQTIRVNGVTTSDLFTDPYVDANYTVDRHCAARFLTPDGTEFGHAVIVDGGREVMILSLSGENTISGVMKKIK